MVFENDVAPTVTAGFGSVDVREYYIPDGQMVSLSSGKFDPLATFLQHPTRVLNRDQLPDLLHSLNL